ncbi:branched-chain amino acid ABC transporter ATP-binding protein/permease [Candidatus Aerophobetes bacterium]|nr:branched-chain amino acid ABC transporter ATP-binding protein/permease [Candidatus Aerophobetes bacterium]
MTFLFAALAEAWNLTGGFAGQASLGHTAFFGIGAYTSSILYLNFGFSPWLGMLAGGGLAVLIAVVIGYPCFKLKSHFFVIATISIGEVLRRVTSYWAGLTGGGKGLLIPFKPEIGSFIFRDKTPYIYIALTLMLISILITYIIRKSRLGFYLISLRENQDAAESLGINTSRCKLIAFVISAFFTGIGGTFYAQYLLFIDPTSVFSLSFSIQLVLLSIIGGLGTIIGPIIGSFILTPLDSLLRGWFGGLTGFNFVVYAIILIIAVIYFPQGIMRWLDVGYKLVLKKLPGTKVPSKVSNVSLPINTFKITGLDRDKGSNILEVKGLHKNFKGLVAVKEVSFEVKKGEILGLIGPNGAGKTTIFNLITGFLLPDSGTVKFKGETITGLRPPHKICVKHIGRTFQLVKPFSKMTVLENVMIGAFSQSKKTTEVRERSKRILSFIGLLDHQDSLAANLTIADRKRLELGRALATHPELLLLDETMAGLNPKETEDIIELIRKIHEQGITLFIIEHVMKAIMSLSDRIVVLNYGEKINEGTPAEVSKNKKVIDAYLGEEYRA